MFQPGPQSPPHGRRLQSSPVRPPPGGDLACHSRKQVPGLNRPPRPRPRRRNFRRPGGKPRLAHTTAKVLREAFKCSRGSQLGQHCTREIHHLPTPVCARAYSGTRLVAARTRSLVLSEGHGRERAPRTGRGRGRWRGRKREGHAQPPHCPLPATRHAPLREPRACGEKGGPGPCFAPVSRPLSHPTAFTW